MTDIDVLSLHVCRHTFARHVRRRHLPQNTRESLETIKLDIRFEHVSLSVAACRRVNEIDQHFENRTRVPNRTVSF
jgi:hypothetical protein